MKKLLDVCVLAGVIIFLIILFQCSTANGDVRRDRSFSSPATVFPGARLVPNQYGGYNYYLNNKKIGYSRANLSGSVDIYHMNRLKYKGAQFKSGTHVFREQNQSVRNSRQSHVEEYRSQAETQRAIKEQEERVNKIINPKKNNMHGSTRWRADYEIRWQERMDKYRARKALEGDGTMSISDIWNKVRNK